MNKLNNVQSEKGSNAALLGERHGKRKLGPAGGAERGDGGVGRAERLDKGLKGARTRLWSARSGNGAGHAGNEVRMGAWG